jgi:hypothetical protein
VPAFAGASAVGLVAVAVSAGLAALDPATATGPPEPAVLGACSLGVSVGAVLWLCGCDSPPQAASASSTKAGKARKVAWNFMV